jgi:hypothetical protein
MISHKYHCIFIHIPKCAGTSIETALGHPREKGRRDHRSIRMVENPFLIPAAFSSVDNILEGLHRFKHQYIDEISLPENKLTVTQEQYRSYFKFTIIRNPWARVYSWYKDVMRHEPHKKYYRITGEISLADFLRSFYGGGGLRPQLYWMKDFNGSIPFDFIGRFENLTEDFQEICSYIGANGIELPCENSGNNADYRDGFNNVSREIVMDLYREEIEFFGYTFER